MSRFKQLAFILFALTITVVYNACSDSGFHSKDLGSLASSDSLGAAIGGRSCDDILKTTYLSTYFPLLSDVNNCNRCHGSAQGSTDPSIAFAAFNLKGKSLIDYQSTHMHQGDNLDLTPQIESLQPAWSRGQLNYQTCLSPPTGTPNPPPTGNRVQLSMKTVANIDRSLTAPGTWLPVSWDLDIDVPTADQNTFHAVFTVQARFALYNGQPVGFEFMNPTVQLKSGQSSPITISDAQIVIAGVPQTNVTTYLGLSATATSVTPAQLAPHAANGLAAYNGVLDSTTMGFSFGSIHN